MARNAGSDRGRRWFEGFREIHKLAFLSTLLTPEVIAAAPEDGLKDVVRFTVFKTVDLATSLILEISKINFRERRPTRFYFTH